MAPPLDYIRDPDRIHRESLARIRADANVSTRTTIVLSTYYENRPVTGG